VPLPYLSAVLVPPLSVITRMTFGLLLRKQIVTFKGQNEPVNIVKTFVDFSH